VTIVGLVVGLFLIDWQLTLMVLVFFPLVIVPIVILGKKVRRSAKAGLNTTITQASLIVEVLSGIRVVKAFNLEEQQVERFRKMSKDLVSHSMRTTRAKEITNPIIESIGTLGFGLLVVVIVVREVKIEDMVSLLTGVAFIYTPVKKLAGIHNLLQQTQAGIERLMQVLREEPTVRETSTPVPMGAFHEGIRVEALGFSYGHEKILNDVSFELPRGTRLGIAGESGSGKSTLVNLLFRFYDPTSGAIRIDGKDLRTLALSDLRDRMALVSQEVVLFNMTVAENIACGRPGATRAEIEAAARAAFAHDFIERLPQGYDTPVAERGVNLSGGQRQRLAIARAFVRNAPILVLDEATAALDAQSEAEVQVAIERLEENRASLVHVEGHGPHPRSVGGARGRGWRVRGIAPAWRPIRRDGGAAGHRSAQVIPTRNVRHEALSHFREPDRRCRRGAHREDSGVGGRMDLGGGGGFEPRRDRPDRGHRSRGGSARVSGAVEGIRGTEERVAGEDDAAVGVGFGLR
jgi:subfamily B ATP-binding cassette protein MsbA